MRPLSSGQLTPLEADATRPVFLIHLAINGEQLLSTGGDYVTPTAAASGGTETTISEGGVTYKVHTFTSNGTLTVSTGGEFEYLIVAGGGGGGTRHGGGGGAGGWRSGTATVAAGAASIVVGSGGAGGVVNTSRGANGGDSSAFGITATGGGGGGSFNANSNGADGGSGGGACSGEDPYATPGAGTSGQGYAGGTVTAGGFPGTGGGGAGATGGTNVEGVGGAGGDGLSSSINGTATMYAGGGGGAGETTAGAGGDGGGGAGAIGDAAPTAGTANTGGGGGGARNASAISLNGGAGGSGVVIVRYPITSVAYAASDVRVSAMSNWMEAALEFAADADEVGIVTGGDWVRAPCAIYLLPASGVDPVLLLDGVVTAAAANAERVRYTVTHRAAAGRWTPRVRMTSQWLRHLPAPGTRFLWQGDTYILESRR